MTTATLTARDAPEHGPGWRYLEVDCKHATTVSYAQNLEQAGITEDLLVRVLLLRHHTEERCQCTRKLRRRYGVSA